MTPTLYGISNCDVVRKARTSLNACGVRCVFHDWRRDGVDAALMRGWIARLGWEALLNRGGTTFRKLPEAERDGLDAERALAIMLANPAAIRRPVLVRGDTVIVGFDADRYASLA